MIKLQTFGDLANRTLDNFVPKPTSLTEGQKEAFSVLWESDDGSTKIGVWECMPGRFTADRTAAGEYCHIIAGRASVTNADGSGTRDVGPGDLLVLPQGWTGSWEIHERLRKMFIIDASLSR